MSELSKEEVLHFAQEAYPEAAVVDIEQLAQAGSDRIYYRIFNGAQRSIIATQSANILENERFILLANYFEDKEISVPQILAVHSDKNLYLQNDAGKKCLLDKVLEEGHTEEVKAFYQKVLTELVRIQLCAKDDAFQALFAELPSFGYDQIIFDLRYFKNNFASKSDVQFDDSELEKEFDLLAKSLDKERGFFMYRDCQGRNIMVKEDEIVFIDFQGGLQGHPMYDVASLLWQAKARIPAEWKAELVELYLNEFQKEAKKREVAIDINQWKEDYAMLTLTRLLQVLGAYGLRGLIEGKEHFISSIPLGLQNIKEWLGGNSLSQYPTLLKLLEQISEEDFIKKFK
jgi:aminoglycoside/choline kinase family phosphotransferase